MRVYIYQTVEWYKEDGVIESKLLRYEIPEDLFFLPDKFVIAKGNVFEVQSTSYRLFSGIMEIHLRKNPSPWTSEKVKNSLYSSRLWEEVEK